MSGPSAESYDWSLDLVDNFSFNNLFKEPAFTGSFFLFYNF